MEPTALAAALRAAKICTDAGMRLDLADHRRWCDDRVREPVVIHVGEPETRGAYLKKHTTYLLTDPHHNLRVRRRFSDFEWLQSVLRGRYIGLLIPSLPEKNLVQTEAFVQSRIRGLGLFLQHLMASPYLRGDATVAKFLHTAGEKEWEAAKKELSILEHGGAGHKRWIKRIATQPLPSTADAELAAFKRQVDQEERLVVELTACAKRLVEKSAAMAKDVGVIHSLLNGWSVAEARSGSPQRFEMRHTLDRTTAVLAQWSQTAAHEPVVYELILYESLRYLCAQVRDMKEILVQRETAALQAVTLQQSQGSAKASVVNAASSLASRFRSGSDGTSQSQLDQNLQRAKDAAELITKAMVAEEMERFRSQKTRILDDAINHFACAQGQLAKKASSIWREHVKTHVQDKDALLASTKQILETASSSSVPSVEANFA